jgi:S-adenosylmethionine:tRNA ribosyltransferase-isomerase
MPPLTLDDFDYALPAHLIAQQPLPVRSASRLLEVCGHERCDRHFADLPQRLEPGDLLVLNDSRVLHARLLGRKTTGGAVEVLIERFLPDQCALAQIRCSKTPRPGTRLHLEASIDVEVLSREADLYRIRFGGVDAREAVERVGRLPLPPYIARPVDAADEQRYQTVFARHPGSVAAPTAGLHIDEPLLDALHARGVRTAFVTLHVGAGTFSPVRTPQIHEHRMHSEDWVLGPEASAAIAQTRARGRRVIAVGTTSLRVLESAAIAQNTLALAPGSGSTDLFITPGFRFQVVDALITNFHWPQSTLLMLVSAFGGLEPLRAAYAHAIRQAYRFYSYGDALLIHPDPSAALSTP